MKHLISITTVDALIILKALQNYDFQNDVDRKCADRLIESITKNVVKDLPLDAERE